MRHKPAFRRLAAAAGSAILAFASMPAAFAYSGVAPYFQEEIASADTYGLIPDLLFHENLSRDITRKEFCYVVMAAYELAEEPAAPVSVQNFSDTSDAVINLAFEKNIVRGTGDGTFQPDNTITRQELFQMVYNLMNVLGEDIVIDDDAIAATLAAYSDSENVSNWARTSSAYLLSRDIIRGSGNSILPNASTTRAEAIVVCQRYCKDLEFLPPSQDLERPLPNEPLLFPDDPEAPSDNGTPPTQLPTPSIPISDSHLSEVGYSEEKYTYLFGSADAPKYQSQEEADAHMTVISVPVWNLREDGTKYAASLSFRVHEKIADRVIQVFSEIFNSTEQFPIYEAGGYAWRGGGSSEHNYGLAIDINANENYMIKNGQILAGSLWQPGENPYSIPEDSEVVAIFHKYGFTWGGNAWQSNRDYMHFSYLGT